MTSLVPPGCGGSTPEPWEAKYVSGAGWQIHAHLPAGFKISGIAKPMVGGEPAFMTWTLREKLQIAIGDERWVQFGTGDWDNMQAANAQLIAEAPALLAFCKIFAGEDERFQVAVGGNPIAVDKMLAELRSAIHRASLNAKGGE